MGRREIVVKETAAENISEIAWYIESQGLPATAEKFTDDIYDLIVKLADSRRSHALCREPERAKMGYKCVAYKKKYTIVFIETDDQIIICEFTFSKNMYWH